MEGGVTVNLPARNELIIQVPEKEMKATIKLEQGQKDREPRVDGKGAPLIVNVPYTLLPGSVINVFAWSSCRLKIEGSPQLLKNIFRTPSHSIVTPLVEFHSYLNARRKTAQESRQKGPILLICGKHAEMKNTIAQMLCNYATRVQWKPLLVDMNCGAHHALALPGCVSAAVVEYPITIDQILQNTLLTVSYFVGSLEYMTEEKGEVKMNNIYSHYCKVLGEMLSKRLLAHTNDVYGPSGAIVVLPYLYSNAGINFISDMIYQLDVDSVLCFDDDDTFNRLYLRHEVNEKSKVMVDKLSYNFSSVPELPQHAILSKKFEEFFNGSGQTVLFPSHWAKPFSFLEILCMKDIDDQFKLVQLEREEIEGVVGYIGALFRKDPAVSILEAAPLCFVRLQSVDANGITFFTTTHNTFESEKLTLIVGDLRWVTTL